VYGNDSAQFIVEKKCLLFFLYLVLGGGILNNGTFASALYEAGHFLYGHHKFD
jgi:hypothetical protein